MNQFEVINLKFSYPGSDTLALDNMNFVVKKGEYIAVCGKSGGGKTTMLKHLKPQLTPHGAKSGEILFEGLPISDAAPRRLVSSIGYVMQNPDNQVVTDKVWHELAFGLESLGFDQKSIRTKVAEMASFFGIQGWFHKNVSELSGGQKQLLNLASIMAMQPEVLILDEPTSQLDPIAASDFLNTVKKINLELGTTIIISEHRLEDILHSADRVLVIDKGKIIVENKPEFVGKALKDSSNPMFTAMPTPVQIYYGVENGSSCPLTVRDGRAWLDSHFENKEIKKREVEDKEVLEELTEKEAAITLKELWFRYEREGTDILKGLSMIVPKNKLFAIVGGNGTGKSTSLKTICGINKPYRGKVLIEGKDIKKMKSGQMFEENIAMLPQDPLSLFLKKTVKEDLESVLQGKKIERDDVEKKVKEIASLCEIDMYLSKHPYDLSGGEQQRAALAKVLLKNPKILLLDEPTKGIDSFFKIKLAGILEKLKHRGVTIVMVSHDIEFCAKHADSVSMFFDGDIITTNTPNRFFSSNSFYTTAANRMGRHIFKNAVKNEDVISLCKENA